MKRNRQGAEKFVTVGKDLGVGTEQQSKPGLTLPEVASQLLLKPECSLPIQCQEYPSFYLGTDKMLCSK